MSISGFQKLCIPCFHTSNLLVCMKGQSSKMKEQKGNGRLKRLKQMLQITWFQCCSGKALMFSLVSPRDLKCTYTGVYYFVLKTLTEFNKSKTKF